MQRICLELDEHLHDTGDEGEVDAVAVQVLVDHLQNQPVEVLVLLAATPDQEVRQHVGQHHQPDLAVEQRVGLEEQLLSLC